MSETPDFEVQIESGDGAVTLRVRGDMDIATVDDLQEARAQALAREPRRLLIDLEKVAFVDSSGLKFLIDTQRLAEREGWELALLKPGEAAMQVFVVTGAERYLPFVEREE